jgi:hypothetical protein
MLKRAAFAFLFLTVSAQAAPPAPEDMAASLIEAKGRYTIGPWSGYQMGDVCYLANTEPLAGGDLVISAAPGATEIQFQLGEKSLHVAEGLSGLARQPFFTIEGRTYDMHGFSRAMALFEQCETGQLADALPDEPVEESEPVPVAGAAGWQVTTLTMGDYVYAKLATLDGAGKFGLGLWRHNANDYVLNVTALGGLPALANPPEVTLTWSAAPPSLKLLAILQKDGILLPLTVEQVAALARAPTLKLVSGTFTADFSVQGIDKAIAALKGGLQQ